MASMEIRIDVNADKTKYMVMSQDKIAGRSHNMNIDNRSFEMVEEFKYLGTTLKNQNSTQEEIKSRMKSGNACYHSVQNLLSSSLLTKNLKIKIYRTIILSVVFYGCKTWSLTLREKRRLRVTGEWRKLHNKERNDLYSSPNTFWVIKSRRMRWAGHVARVGERRGVCRVFLGKPEGKRPLWRPKRTKDNI